VAGVSPDFDAAGFRTAIQAVMQMGTPQATPPIFRWTPQPVYTSADPAGRPYSFTEPAVVATPAATTYPDVVVNCAVAPATATPEETAMGEFDVTKVVITLLDVDYALISGPPAADTVIFGGNIPYTIDYVAPPEALFNVTIYTIYATARDQS
jgi:hypothetical protein